MRSYLLYVLGVVAAVVLTSATGFYFAELGTNQNLHGFGDAVWWAIVTVTTIGYGDIFPVTVLGRIVGGFLMFAGIGTLSLFTAATAAYLIRIGGLDALRVRRISDHVVICGLGNAGLLFAQAFRREGYTVLAVEKVEDSPHVMAARESGAAVLIGDAARAEVLARARLHVAKHIVIVAGDDANNVEIAAQALARGLERRTKRVAVPGWVRGALLARGVLNQIAERDAHQWGAELDRMYQQELEEHGEAATRPVGAGGEAVTEAAAAER